MSAGTVLHSNSSFVVFVSGFQKSGEDHGEISNPSMFVWWLACDGSIYYIYSVGALLDIKRNLYRLIQ